MAYTKRSTPFQSKAAGNTPVTADWLNQVDAALDEHEKSKLSKPTTGSGPMVYNPTTGAWEAAPTGGVAGSDPTLTTADLDNMMGL